MNQACLIPIPNKADHETRSLSEIIQVYIVTGVKLFHMADIVAETQSEVDEHAQEETRLLDKQAGLLNTALSCEVQSIDDAKAILRLWHHEVIKSQVPGGLTTADELVNSVCSFFHIGRDKS